MNNKTLNRIITLLFFSISALFISLFASIFFEYQNFRLNFLMMLSTLLILSVILMILVLKSKKKQKSLILFCLAIIAFVVFSVLHNLFYALGIIFEQNQILKIIMNTFEVASFFISIIISPIIFLIAITKSLIKPTK